MSVGLCLPLQPKTKVVFEIINNTGCRNGELLREKRHITVSILEIKVKSW